MTGWHDNCVTNATDAHRLTRISNQENNMNTRLLILPLALFACEAADKGDGGLSDITCTQEARSSVSISVVDQSGAPLTPESVMFSVNGGDERSADCVDDQCTQWVAGWEETGEFLVTATNEADLGRRIARLRRREIKLWQLHDGIRRARPKAIAFSIVGQSSSSTVSPSEALKTAESTIC